MTDIITSVTPALHPDNVKQIDGYSEQTAPFLGDLETVLSEAYEGIGSVHTARVKAARNPTWNEAQQAIETQKFANKVQDKITRRFDAIHSRLSKGIEHLEGELSGPVESTARGNMGAEIRSYARGLATGERMAFVRQAINQGDTLTASSVLGGPAYLSGLENEMQAALTKQYHSKQNPDLAARLKVMLGARSLIQERGGLVFAELEKAVGMSPSEVSQLAARKNEAEAAMRV